MSLNTVAANASSQRWCYRLAYATINILLLVLLWSFRGSWLTDTDGNTLASGSIPLILLICVTFAAYGLVQGSNPGYVYAGE